MAKNNILDVVIEILIFLAFLGFIGNAVAGISGNVTGAALVLVGLMTLFITIGFIIFIFKSFEL